VLPLVSVEESKSPRRRIVVLLVVAATAIGGYFLYRRYQASRPFEWYGTIEARTISVGSRTGGRVREVLVREGDRVEAGQALVILEPGDLPARKLQAEGQLAEAQAAYDRLKTGARPEEIAEAKARADEAKASASDARAGPRKEEIAAAQARVEAAEATLAKAKTDAARAKKLGAQGAISEAQVDSAETAERLAASERDAARETLKALVKGTRPQQVRQAEARASAAAAVAQLVESGSRVEDLRGAEARVTAARGRLMQVETEIDELTIRAPKAAQVESLDLRPGDLLPPSATAAKLLEPDELYVRIYVPETQLGFVRPGLEVPISVDSFPDRTFAGVVEFVSEQGEFTPRNLQTADERANQVFSTRVRLDEGTDVLRAGMAAVVHVAR
jgi:HlyD family secretion protein